MQSIYTNTENDVQHQYRGNLGAMKAFGGNDWGNMN